MSCARCVEYHQRAPRNHQDEEECEERESSGVGERRGERNESVGGYAEQEKQRHQKKGRCREEGGATTALEELTESRDQRRGKGIAKVWCGSWKHEGDDATQTGLGALRARMVPTGRSAAW